MLTLEKNRGKGGAVRLGMLSARGRHLLFADADGASKFADVVKLEECLKKMGNREVCLFVCLLGCLFVCLLACLFVCVRFVIDFSIAVHSGLILN